MNVLTEMKHIACAAVVRHAISRPTDSGKSQESHSLKQVNLLSLRFRPMEKLGCRNLNIFGATSYMRIATGVGLR